MKLKELLVIIENQKLDKQSNPNFMKFTLISGHNWLEIKDVIVDKKTKTIQLFTE